MLYTVYPDLEYPSQMLPWEWKRTVNLAFADLACRTGAIFLRFSGDRERGQARGEREVRDTLDGRGAKKMIVFAPLPSRVSRTSRSPHACPRSPEKRQKNSACSAGYR